MSNLTPPKALPPASWQEGEGLARIVEALNSDGGTCRYVGGAVRDTLLGLPVSDIDIATSLLPQNVMDRLKSADIKAIPTGIDHGTVTAVTTDGPVEITTLRKDVSTDGRRATIAFSDDWREDAARRDFTMNALYADPKTGEIFDYFDGVADLKNGQVRFIGKASERIAEDHLRIMRYFRFLARFGAENIDEAAYKACQAQANNLMALSRERIADELIKLLKLANPLAAVTLMVEGGIFKPVIPEITAKAAQSLEELLAKEEKSGVVPFALRRLLSLLPTDAKLVDKVATRLKFSKKMRKVLADRLQYDPTRNILDFAYRYGNEAAQDMALLFQKQEQVVENIAMLKTFQKPIFPLRGGDLIRYGVPAGPDVARLLKEIERKWIEEGFPDENRVDQLLSITVPSAFADFKKE